MNAKDRAPWFVVIRRLLVLPVFLVGFVMVFFSLLIGWGIRSAMDFWYEQT